MALELAFCEHNSCLKKLFDQHGLRFYPSMASVSTHFSRYRATALGVAAAGSSLGLFYPPWKFLSHLFTHQPGGVCYPIILHRLFQQVGFGWGVRVSGFVSGVGCVVATILTTNLPQPIKAGASLKVALDSRFALLTAGSCLIALGMHRFTTREY